MAAVSIVKLKIRRGTDAERKQITLDVGEIGYVTDVSSRRLFVGDGSTKGGNPAGIKFFTGSLGVPVTLQTAQVGDVIYNTQDNKMYCLTGVDVNNFPNYSVPSAYQFIGTKTDNSTIQYTGIGTLEVVQNGIQANHLNSNIVDYSNGLTRSTPTGPFSVNYDNVTITVVGGALKVNTGALNIGQLNSINQSIDASTLKLINLPSSNPLDTGRLWRDPATGNLKVS